MRFLKHICLALCTSFAWAAVAWAHDADMATLDVQEVSQGGYVLHIRTPLFHLDEAVRRDSEDGEALVYGSAPYKLALADYIKNNIYIAATRQNPETGVTETLVEVGATALKLGSHETSIILALEGVDASVLQLQLTAPLMSENPDQKNIFRVIEGDKIKKVFLDSGNKFSGTIKMN